MTVGTDPAVPPSVVPSPRCTSTRSMSELQLRSSPPSFPSPSTTKPSGDGAPYRRRRGPSRSGRAAWSSASARAVCSRPSASIGIPSHKSRAASRSAWRALNRRSRRSSSSGASFPARRRSAASGAASAAASSGEPVLALRCTQRRSPGRRWSSRWMDSLASTRRVARTSAPGAASSASWIRSRPRVTGSTSPVRRMASTRATARAGPRRAASASSSRPVRSGSPSVPGPAVVTARRSAPAGSGPSPRRPRASRRR